MITVNSSARKEQRRRNKSYYGFTLVELIVVISIVSILALIGFVTIKGFQANARDGVRVSDIKSIHKWLSIFKIQAGSYPLPEDYIASTDSGTIISLQGYIWESVARAAKISPLPLDPTDKSRYIYSVDKNQKKLQIMGYLESWDSLGITTYNFIIHGIIDSVYAFSFGKDYDKRFPYVLGDKIGVLVDRNNTPFQETAGSGVNLLTTGTGYVAIFWGDTYGAGRSTGTGQILVNQMLGAMDGNIASCDLPWTGTLTYGESIAAFSTATVPSGDTCISEMRTCVNGTLSWSFTFPSCVAGSNYCTLDSPTEWILDCELEF